MEKLTLKVGNLFIVANRFSGSKDSKRVLFFNHATGFCKEVWNPLIEELRKQGNTDEIVTIDQANHGDSAILNHGKLPNEPQNNDGKWSPFSWNWNGEHVVGVLNQLYPKEIRKTKKIYGIGHSGGGAAILLAQIFQPGLFDGLIPIEPIVMPKALTGPNGRSLAASKRRRYFSSREEVYNSFISKKLFEGCEPRAVKAYTENGFRDVDARFGDTEKTGVTLKCDPKQEEATFLGSNKTDIFERISEIKVPAYFLRGTLEDAISEEIIKHALISIKGSTAKNIEGTGHLLTFQKCALIAREINDWINSLEPKSKL